MSRRGRKKTEKKFKVFFRLCVFMQIILLIYGLSVVDFRIRTTLGIDEASLISYKQSNDGKYNVHIMGNSRSINFPTMKTQIYDKFAKFREMTYSIREWAKEIFKTYFTKNVGYSDIF